MKRNIWIINHYATNMYKDQAGRHYWFAENLIEKGYKPVIFCASTIHNSDEIIDTGKKKYTSDEVNNIPFVFVNTPEYKKNGSQRIKNMFAFYNNLFSVTKSYVKKSGYPDAIVASSVHPLTLVAGIKIAKKLGVPCICEVRDLWPESIVAYGILNRNNLIAKALYQGEKWIYKRADSIIMTWAGGKQYIIDMGWEKQIDLKKIHHISNGVAIDTFDDNTHKYNIDDPDLDDDRFYKVVYTGSIRKVNNLGMILDTAKVIQNSSRNDIKFLIYGAGDETEELKERCLNENINNVVFKGRVEKKYVPSILKKSDINLLHNSSTSLDKYGQSQNKYFEYLAAGRCVLQTYTTGFSELNRRNCGISVNNQNSIEIAEAIMTACEDSEKLILMGKNARKLAYEYDFSSLTNKLISVIENN